MIDKRILFIDDKPDTLKEQLEAVTPRLKTKGINIEPDFLDVGNNDFIDQSQNLDLDKVLAFTKENHFATKYAVVACDLNFVSGSNVAGYFLLKDIINAVTGTQYAIRHAQFVFYSAQTEKLKDAVLAQDELEKLIRLRIAGIFRREKVSEGIAGLLKKQINTFSLTSHLTERLGEYTEHSFQSIYPQFIGKTIAEVVREIENKTHHGVEFEKLFIELTVANILELNFDE